MKNSSSSFSGLVSCHFQYTAMRAYNSEHTNIVAEETDTIVMLRESKVDSYSLAVSDMKIAIWLRRKSRSYVLDGFLLVDLQKQVS